jgi:hypothetical protein
MYFIKYLSKIGRILTVKLLIQRKMPRLAFDVDDQFSQEFNELVQLTGASSKADAFRKAIKEQYNALHNPDSSKIEAIFNQIDLAQARISKDQEEIQSLAKETDELLNQWEYKAG